MSILTQKTVSKKISLEGIGILTGVKAHLDILPANPNIGIIFKCGDDLRQDQIVMSFCSLIQNILNNSGTKVKILTYDIIARSRTEGCVEVVPNAKSINEIKYEFPIQYAPGFLAKSLEANKEQVMNNLVESCAGACLYSYVLALGDRHLDNLMMTDLNNHLLE